MIIIETVPIPTNEDLVNTSNFKMKYCPIKNEIIPFKSTREEYIKFTKDTLVSNYSNLYNDITIIPLLPSEITLLIDASKVFLNSLSPRKDIPSIYQEELTDLANKIDKYLEPTIEYFCRFDSCSPKDAGILKVKSGMDCIKLIINSKRLFLRADDGIAEKIILRPWKQFIYENAKACEIRVFVYNGKMTAISQYSPYGNYNFIRLNSKEILETLEKQLISLINTVNLTMNLFTLNYALDVFINDFEKPMDITFIEINPFGMESPCGSCLFHWINDYKLLYNTENSNDIIFRVCG